MTGHDERDVEAALRASLAHNARNAPDGEALAERIIRASERGAAAPAPSYGQAGTVAPGSRHGNGRGWGTWTWPLVAAASIVVIAGALVGVHEAQQPSSHGHPLAIGSSSPPASTPAPVPSTTTPAPVVSESGDSIYVQVIGLTNFRVHDTTFVGANDGWALGTADCLIGPGTCVGMVRTTDGTTWSAVTNPPVNLAGVSAGCTTTCATNIRFANDQIGYVFGPSALFMTVDGGASWKQQSGGAYALETLDGNVIRVSAACLPGCPFTVQIAPIGSAAWQTVALPGTQAAMNAGVTLSRTGSSAFIEIYGHVAGGASDATSVLYSSVDDGVVWTRRGEPCDQVGYAPGREIDSTAMTTASDGSVTLVCTPRGWQGPQFTVTSTDAGGSFQSGAHTALGAAPVSAIGAASARTLLVADGDTFRSVNGGASFARVGANGRPTPGDAEWIGFESATVGRAISADGRQIWTTRDAGATWTSYTFD